MPQHIDKIYTFGIICEKINIYGSDLSRWPDLSDDQRQWLHNKIQADPELKKAYDQSHIIDSHLDVLKDDAHVPASVRQAASQYIQENQLSSSALNKDASNDNYIKKAAYASIFAVAIICLAIVPFIFSSTSKEPKIDVFLDEIYAMTDEQQIDPNIFFEDIASSDHNKDDIDEFLDHILPYEDNHNGIIDNNEDIWDMFMQDENERT